MKGFRYLVIYVAVLVVSASGVQSASAGFMDGLKNLADKATNLGSKQQSEAQVAGSVANSSLLKVKKYYAGYSKGFQKCKTNIKNGKAEKAYTSREKIIAKKKKGPNVLFAWEQSLMALDADKRGDAIKYLDLSESLLEKRKDKSVTAGAGKKALTEAIKFVGFDEFGDYEGEAFERILMLNFKSIAYLLDGDRKAYNVTRRSIDWQNAEKKAFDIKMVQIKKDLKKEESPQGDKKNDTGLSNAFKEVGTLFKGSESKAMEVASAFVNPFGFFMAGVVQEYDSLQDPSLRDNARISYKKALKLNPKSEAIKQALKSIKKKVPKNQRLIQIVVADGFAPEKQVARFNLPVSGSMVPIKIPIYVQDESQVTKVEVQDSKGKCLATLSQVADIDAITMRHQYDSLPEQRLRLALTIGRSIVENKVAQSAGIIGMIGKKVRDDTTNPDMRSWMGLPKQILATRLLLSKGVDGLQLVSFDEKGKVLVRKKLKLRKNDHNFVYARSFDDVLYVNQSKKMWVTM